MERPLWSSSLFAAVVHHYKLGNLLEIGLALSLDGNNIWAAIKMTIFVQKEICESFLKSSYSKTLGRIEFLSLTWFQVGQWKSSGTKTMGMVAEYRELSQPFLGYIIVIDAIVNLRLLTLNYYGGKYELSKVNIL